jgi:hypothetical protein
MRSMSDQVAATDDAAMERRERARTKAAHKGAWEAVVVECQYVNGYGS